MYKNVDTLYKNVDTLYKNSDMAYKILTVCVRKFWQRRTKMLAGQQRAATILW
jgi:hypothetical protein